MATSKRWKHLKAEVETLRKQFLPDPFDPLGVYAEQTRVQAHARAFLVLSHAEMESYIEEWAKDIVRSSETLWLNSRRIAQPLHFVMATLAQRIGIPPTLVGPSVKDSPQRLDEEMDKLFPRYYKRVKDNNGIKEGNILALLGPLGVPITAFGSTTLLPNLDSFGKLRGTHAHYSVKAVATPLDPETEYKRARDLVNELTDLDQWLLQAKRRIR
jgi:hypothetical protein